MKTGHTRGGTLSQNRGTLCQILLNAANLMWAASAARFSVGWGSCQAVEVVMCYTVAETAVGGRMCNT